MAVQVIKKWGNSPAVHLPAAVMAAAHLAPDQAVDVRLENGRVIMEPAAPAYALDDLVADITPENVHPEQDFGAAQGRESS